MTVRYHRMESERSAAEQQFYDLQKATIRQDLRDLCQKKGCSLTEEQFIDLAGYLLLETRKQYRKLLSDTFREFVLQGRPKILSGRVSEVLFLLTTEERFPAYQYLLGKQVGNALIRYLQETGRVDPQMELPEMRPSKFSLSVLLESLTEPEQQELFFVLLEPFVKQDVMIRMKIHPSTIKQETSEPAAKLAQRAAELYVWDQVYDNNRSYWENLDQVIALAISPGVPEHRTKEYRKGSLSCLPENG